MSYDPLLEPVLRATGEAVRERAIEQVIATVAEPLAQRIVSRYTSAAAAMTREDAEDVVGTVVLSLLRKLRALDDDAVIRDFSAYVATLTYNAIHDQLRRRYPNRTRLKNRVRYLLLNDDRLELRTTSAGLAAALASWSESDAAAQALDLGREGATRTMQQQERPAEAIIQILRSAGKPVLFDALVETLAELWEITDAPPLTLEAAEPLAGNAAQQFESRDLLRALWSEIRALPLPQRKALLLNLRDRESANAISVLALSGVATIDEIASAIEITPDDLGALWNRLPLDDITIAGMLGLTRQQVINLRKSARERLARRVFARKR